MSILNVEEFIRTPLQHDPCDFVVVPEFVRPESLGDLARDFPRIEGPGSVDPSDVPCGPTFSKLLGELHSDALRQAVSEKFGVELESLPLQVGVRRYAAATDGNIHNDSRSKFVTALIYFNDVWDAEGGRLRLLRDPQDIDSHVAEIAPVRGTLFCFRRSANSYHGFKPFEGERRSLQMYWVHPKRGARGGPKQTPEFVKRLKRFFKTG